MPNSVARRMSANPAHSERSRFRLPRQGWEAKPWGQREQFRQREEQRLEGGEEASFRYRFFGAVKQPSALVLARDASARVCVPVDAGPRPMAASWEL